MLDAVAVSLRHIPYFILGEFLPASTIQPHVRLAVHELQELRIYLGVMV